MPTGIVGKVQRSFWVSRVAGEKLRRMVLARGGRCGSQVAEEAINLLYRNDPNMAGMPPIPGDELASAKGSGEPVPLDEFDLVLATAEKFRGPLRGDR